MSQTVRWVDSTSWELSFFGLPQHIPWPAEIDPAEANRDPLEVDHLLQAIERLGSEAQPPFSQYLAAAPHLDALLEALEENEMTAALQALDQVEAILPGTAFALFYRAHIARREGSEEQAIQYYRDALQKTPAIAAIWTSLGTLLAMRGERDEAVKAYKHALTLQPQDMTALEGLASLRELVKLKATHPQQGEGLRYVDLPTFRALAAQRINSMSDAEALFGYGEQLLRDGTAVDAAILALERSNALHPAQPRTMHALAASYHAHGRTAEGLELMQRFTQMHPQDPNGWMHLAQLCEASQDSEGSQVALAAALRIDPNLQPALMARFRLSPGEHDPSKEDELAAYGEANRSWMAYILACTLARERGDHRAALREARHAFALAPENEEVLLHYATSLAEMKELATLASTLRPAVESGKYTKRLDWHYAHVLRGLNLTKEAVEVLRRAVTGPVTDEFRKMVATTLDAWGGLITGCGVRLDVMPNGFLQRPILISLADGDGGVLIDAGAKLPAEAKFTWRAQGERTAVALQQGESGGIRPSQKLGVFRVRGVRPAAGSPATVDCHLTALPDGALHFRSAQTGRKLEVSWAVKEVV